MAYTHIPQKAGDLIRSADWNLLGDEVQRLDGAKVDRAGDTITGALAVRGDLSVGTPNAGAAVRVLKKQEDGTDLAHGALIVGSDSPSSASLRLGYGSGYSWLQGQGKTTLAINPRGGDVGVGTDAPRSRLSVAGALAVGAGYASGNTAPANSLIVQGSVGIGTPTPRSELDTWRGVMTGAANDYLKAQFTLSGGGTVTWAASRLKWTARFIAISAGRGPTFAQGYVDINMPPADLPAQFVYDGAARSASPAAGILLNAWEALYAVHTVGGSQADVTFRIVRHTNDHNVPSNWLLVAVVNGDDNTVRLGTGEIIGRNTQLPRLDVAENHTATVRAMDFAFGHSTRKGGTGRALVDNTRTLVVNYGGDWPDGVQVMSNLSVTGSQFFGNQVRQMLNLWGTGEHGIGVQSSTTYFRTHQNFAFFRGGAHNDAAFNAGGGALALAIHGNGNVGIGTAAAAPRSELDTGRGVLSGAANDYIKAQFTLSGGGVVTWTGGRLHWTQRFIAISANQGTSFSAGYVDINVPGDIPAQFVYDGAVRSSTPAAGVTLTAWEALYAVHTVGSHQGDVSFRIVRYTHAFNAPSNWILVAVVNGDTNTVKLGTGAVVGGAIVPAAGNAENAGIMFPRDPGGGGGDAAWIRYYARAGEATTFELGTSNDADDHITLMPSGNVGIRTQDPKRNLHVEGSEVHSGGAGAGYSFSNRESAYVEGGGAGDRWVLYASGRVAKLWSAGDKMWVNAAGQVFSVGGFHQGSSRELKTDIADLALDEAERILEGLNPVRYRLKADETGEPQLGFIAEDVPDPIATADHKAITSHHIVAVLTRVVKEQQRRIDALSARLEALHA